MKNQSHRPIREHVEMHGHGVCACYLYAGVTDVAVETGDRELIKVSQRLWKNLTQKHLYITGGIGGASWEDGVKLGSRTRDTWADIARFAGVLRRSALSGDDSPV